MMRKTSFAVSTDESRYVLNGIYISLKDHKMTMVATDGGVWRWWMRKWTFPKKQRRIYCTRQSGNELNRLLQEKGDVEIKFGENQASFALKDDKGFSVLVVTKLIEAITRITGR